jgi:hypothetical protein
LDGKRTDKTLTCVFGNAKLKKEVMLSELGNCAGFLSRQGKLTVFVVDTAADSSSKE